MALKETLRGNILCHVSILFFRVSIGTLSPASNTKVYALPVDMFVRFGGSLTLSSSQPTLLVENGRTLTWCGGIEGVKNLLIGANGEVQADYPAHTGTDTRNKGTF